jgi:hypothetical protein
MENYYLIFRRTSSRKFFLTCVAVVAASLSVFNVANADIKRIQPEFPIEIDTPQIVGDPKPNPKLIACLNEASDLQRDCFDANDEARAICEAVFSYSFCKQLWHAGFNACLRASECARLECHGLRC